MSKRLIIIGCIVALFVIGIVIVTCILDYNKNRANTRKEIREKLDKKKECINFTGGSFNIIFYTNGGNEIPNMSVCIACSPDSYLDLPIPEKEGYNFDGWYYDSELTKKIDFTNTKDFKPIAKYNKNKCIIGYKDRELFAKWSEVNEE